MRVRTILIILCNIYKAGFALWWEHLPFTIVARVQFPYSAAYVVEFAGSLLCSEKFFPGYSGVPLSPKTNIWFDLLNNNLNK